MVLLSLIEVVEDLLAELRVVDGLAVRRCVDGDDMAGGVAAVGGVGDQRRLDRLAALVVEPALGDVFTQVHAEDPAADTQRDHETDDDVSIPVYGSTHQANNRSPY